MLDIKVNASSFEELILKAKWTKIGSAFKQLVRVKIFKVKYFHKAACMSGAVLTNAAAKILYFEKSIIEFNKIYSSFDLCELFANNFVNNFGRSKSKV